MTLWEVIVNGDAPAIASASAGTKGLIPPKTAEQKLARKNELKDEKTSWEAIKAMFGGNKESKKMQKTILKQQYKNFTTSRSEGLDKTYDRFQKLINQLEIHGEVNSQEDANLSCEEVYLSFGTIMLNHVGNKADPDTLSHGLTCTNQLNSQLDNEDLEQIDTDDLEEMVSNGQVGPCLREGEEILKEDRKESEFQWQRNCYQIGLESLEARIIIHEKNEVVYEEGIGLLNYDVQVKDISIKYLKIS
ncbi:hypothetical protein Tco_0779937 [Tanacetum coccineum]